MTCTFVLPTGHVLALRYILCGNLLFPFMVDSFSGILAKSLDILYSMFLQPRQTTSSWLALSNELFSLCNHATLLLGQNKMLIVPDLSKSMVIRENCGLHSLTTNLACCYVKSGYGLKGPVTLSQIPHGYRPYMESAKDPVQIVEFGGGGGGGGKC